MVEVRNRFEKAFTKSKLRIEDVADLLGVSPGLVYHWLSGVPPKWIHAVGLVRFVYTIEQAEVDGGLSDVETTPRWYKSWWIESSSAFDNHELLKGWSRLSKLMSDMGITASQAAPWVGVSTKQFTDAVVNRKAPRLYYDTLLKFALALQLIHDRGGFTDGPLNEAEFRPIWDRVKKLDLPSRQLARAQRISNTPAAGKNED